MRKREDYSYIEKASELDQDVQSLRRTVYCMVFMSALLGIVPAWHPLPGIGAMASSALATSGFLLSLMLWDKSSLVARRRDLLLGLNNEEALPAAMDSTGTIAQNDAGSSNEGVVYCDDLLPSIAKLSESLARQGPQSVFASAETEEGLPRGASENARDVGSKEIAVGN